MTTPAPATDRRIRATWLTKEEAQALLGAALVMLAGSLEEAESSGVSLEILDEAATSIAAATQESQPIDATEYLTIDDVPIATLDRLLTRWRATWPAHRLTWDAWLCRKLERWSRAPLPKEKEKP